MSKQEATDLSGLMNVQ